MGLSQIPLLPRQQCTAKLQEPSCCLVGCQERSAPSALQQRRTGYYWTTHPPHTPQLHIHTHSLQSRGQAMLDHGPLYTI